MAGPWSLSLQHQSWRDVPPSAWGPVSLPCGDSWHGDSPNVSVPMPQTRPSPCGGRCTHSPAPWATGSARTGGTTEGREEPPGRVTNGHVTSRAAAVRSSDRFGLWQEGAVRVRSRDGCDPAHAPGRQRGTSAPCPAGTPACALPAPASNLAGSEVGVRALRYLWAPPGPAPSPDQDGDSLLSAQGLWGCPHRGVWHKRHKARQGAEVGTVSDPGGAAKGDAHRHTRCLDGDFKGSCHPWGDPSQGRGCLGAA